MAIPTIQWNEGNPSGTQEKSLGAERIRELKTQFREIFSVDHIMSSSGNGDTWGYHNKCTFYNQSTDSIPVANTGCLYAKDVDSKSALHWIDENLDGGQLISSAGFIGGMAGEIRIWSGLIADIPNGWALCDGVSNPLNLVNKFIRGVNTKIIDPGTEDGNNEIFLTTNNLPADHKHTMNPSSGDHTHLIWSNWFIDGTTNIIYMTLTGGHYNEPDFITGDGSHTHSINNTGNSEGLNNRPAYLEEVFIIKT